MDVAATREWEFVVRLGDWPKPECMLWRSPDGPSWLRYDYDTNSYTMLGLLFTQYAHLPIPSKTAKP